MVRLLLRTLRSPRWAWWGGLLLLAWLPLSGCSEDSKQCDSENPCDNPLVCIQGRCERKRCTLDEECSNTEYCDKEVSRCARRVGPTWECRTDRECRTGEICEGGICRLRGSEPGGELPPPDRDPNACNPPCQQGFRCEKGQCLAEVTDPPCKFDSDCKDGRTCNIAVDLCQLPCTADAACRSGRRCKEGFCQKATAPECDAHTPCAASKVCENGACVEPECSGQKPCTAPKVCENNKCVEPECHASKPCTAPKVCRNNKCADPPKACGPGQPCPSDKKCYKSQCVSQDHCENDQDCTSTVRCVSNQCGFCRKDADCYSFQGCVNSKCVTQEKKLGEACNASSECVKGAICAGDGKGNKACRQQCDPFADPSTCPASYGCGLLGQTGAGGCFPKIGAGALSEGDDCSGAKQNQCEVHLTCVNQGNGSSLCMRYCNQNKPACPNNGKCLSVGSDPVGVCEIKGGSGNVPPGQACTSDAQCTKGAACVQAGGGAHQVDICMTLCNPQSPSCPRGAPCVGTSSPTVGVCQVPCSAKADCATGLCLGASGAGTCTTGCDPYQAVCTQGQTCDVVPDPSGAVRGVCGPENKSGGSIGKVCFPGAFSCKIGLICIALTRNQQGQLVGYCGLPCLPGSTSCPRGTACKRAVVNLVGNQSLFGCIPP